MSRQQIRFVIKYRHIPTQVIKQNNTTIQYWTKGYEDSGEAEFRNLYFLKLSDKWHEEPHIPLEQVPPIVYSEVLSELEQIVPKEEVAQ
ncbi:hypothetical protein QNI16_20355 [Cytophagaceae bacterium YF14B1]|uniref:Uncharacterized protein n=1 Tax=Xanthocytophaga flava TaxID=3048013 RepID=A0AAE3QPF8_9BACT|nr:hypothetical protein [Xanthocytophaga flavus]MDJ1482865.1 hypothetical protein [Xanthocytophaga flavus]